MVFKKIGLKDKEEIEKYTFKTGENSCEFTFYNLYIWQNTYGNEFYAGDGVMLVRVGKSGNYTYALPFGDIEKGFDKLKEINGGKYPDIWAQDGERFERFKMLYGDIYEITELRNEYDYLYNRDDLAYLQGKKYHGKRNHIAAFSKKYNWSFEEINAENLYEVKECADKWYAENLEREDEEMQAERAGLEFLFKHYAETDVMGALIRAEGKVVAFTFGSGINREVSDIYVEKALADYSEAYAVINKEFAEKMLSGFKYINREDDLGIEGLKKAKLSYHPCGFVKKYFCRVRDKQAERRIYKQAFGESLPFDDILFENLGKYIQTERENKTPVSVLFKIPCKVDNKDYYYIYAAATDEPYRNKGYMKKLLCRLIEDSDAPLFLVPSSDELVPFYEKCGFKAARAVAENGEINIEVPEIQKQLSRLCDNCLTEFTIMFSETPQDKTYEFPFALM